MCLTDQMQTQLQSRLNVSCITRNQCQSLIIFWSALIAAINICPLTELATPTASCNATTRWPMMSCTEYQSMSCETHFLWNLKIYQSFLLRRLQAETSILDLGHQLK